MIHSPYSSLVVFIFSSVACHSVLAHDNIADDKATTLAHTAIAAGNGGTDALSGLASSGVKSGIESWLSHFGTVRMENGFDSHFRWRNGAFDMLLPLYDRPDTLMLTQYGIRKKEGQVTANLGLGQRHFIGEWMVGYNAFYDHNITGHSRRWGLGSELWHDELRFSMNSYFPISGWRNSSRIDGYDERPARGGDIRVEGYLPAYPQMGGKLMYEKYFGDEVALFGINTRQKNPYAVTVGLNYTPVPLVTLGMDYRTGQSGSHDSRMLASINYIPGIPLSKQTSSEQVSTLRSLAGGRLALVERNNNIVMNYRKQVQVELTLPEEVRALKGTVINFTATATSRHPIARIDWHADELLAAGGKITPLAGQGQYSLALPLTEGQWTVQGQAVDQQGNRSKTEVMRVISQHNGQPSLPGVITNLRMVQRGSLYFDEGFGDLIYSAQTDVAHAGMSVPWSFSVKADGNPVQISGTTISRADGGITIRVPVMQHSDKLNASLDDYSLTANVQGGVAVTTREGDIVTEPSQSNRADIKIQPNTSNLLLNTGAEGSMTLTYTTRDINNNPTPVANVDAYITTNCPDCTLDYGKGDQDGKVVVKVTAGQTPGSYEVMAAESIQIDKGSIKIPLMIK